MEFIQPDDYLKILLSDRLQKTSYENVKPLLYELGRKLTLSKNDLYYIFYKCPDILKANINDLLDNLEKLSLNYNLKTQEVKFLILKFPYFLLFSEKTLSYKLKLLSTTFGVPVKEVFKLIFTNPEILYLTKSHIISQVKMLSLRLHEYGINMRRLFYTCPSLVLITESQVEQVKKILMYDFSLTEEEACNVIKASPSIVAYSSEKLNKLFNFYYPTYFIKRDLKDILVSCPGFLTIETKEFIIKLEDIMKLLNLQQKKACEFIRKEPNILFFESVYQKLIGFSKLSISLSYVSMFPKICSAIEMSIPIKFLITRLLRLEADFDKICELETDEFVSRFIFLQSYGYNNYNDLLLSSDQFYNKYHISDNVLKLSYRLDMQGFKSLCNQYFFMKDTMPNWSDFAFPDLDKALNFISSIKEPMSDTKFEYYKLREKNNLTLGQYLTQTVMTAIHLSLNEATLIMRKNPNIIFQNHQSILKIYSLLKKLGLSQEKILKLFMRKSYILSYSIIDFEQVLEQIASDNNVDIFKAVNLL